MDCIAKRAFISPESGKLVTKGDKLFVRKKWADELHKKGLVSYKTKEDKAPMSPKYSIKHDKGPMFFVLKADEVVERLKKSQAEALRDQLNGVV